MIDDLEEAIRIYVDALGYPCPCESCSTDGGEAISNEILDMAYDLCGITPIQCE